MIGRISDDTNLSFVCEENLGSGILTETTAVKPSRQSSPLIALFIFLSKPSDVIYLFNVRVRAVLKPMRCVPPSF